MQVAKLDAAPRPGQYERTLPHRPAITARAFVKENRGAMVIVDWLYVQVHASLVLI